MSDETTTLSSFIDKLGLTRTVAPAASNPHADGWGPGARHWLVTLAFDGKTMAVPFSQGSAHTELPSLEDVLDCLASDAASIDNSSGFEDWASEYGFDPDSRKAERIYNSVREQSATLRDFLGTDAYEELLWGVER